MDPDMISLDEALQRRDVVLDQVARNAGTWFEDALWCICSMRGTLPDGPFTSDAIRVMVEANVGRPRHYNAWGALIAAAIRQNWIFAVPGRSPALSAGANARKLQLYMKEL